MATTHSGNRSRMPDLSASLNDNTSCAPLSDLWNIPKSKLFPSASTSAATAATAGAAAKPATPAAATPSADFGSPGSDISALTQPISDLSLGGGLHNSSVPYGTSLWGEGQPGAVGAVGSHASHAHSAPGSVGHAAPLPGPVGIPSAGSAASVAGPADSALLPNGSPTFRSQPRSSGSGGIWGSEYPRYHSPSVATFSGAPTAAGPARMVQPPFLQKSGPVRALDVPPVASAVASVPSSVASAPGPHAGAHVAVPSSAASVAASAPGVGPGVAPTPSRSLDSSWDRSAFLGSPGLPSASSSQASLLHQQQQQNQAHRAQKKGTRPSTNTELYKTELCASYMSTGGNCPYGEKCQFAHGTQELKTVDRPPKWRSKPCQNWVKTGTCSYNERCCFRHDIPVAPQ